ncbi:MAG: hypothetical protein JWN69_1317 [Alphaproteobacteria bacterium]|nr:hypothetical protein [Alphaproteobacteria bacterium]
MKAALRPSLPLALLAAACSPAGGAQAPPAYAADAAPAGAPEADMQARPEPLAAQRNPEAAYQLGMIYHLGLNGIVRDHAKAFELFKQAAEAGDPLGDYQIGAYYDGAGDGAVEPDPALALRHKLVAAEAGYALAQYDIAQYYLRHGDRDKGVRWLEAAARQGDALALLALGSYHSGRPFADARDGAKYYAYSLLSVERADDEAHTFAAELKAMFATGLSAQEIAEGEKIIAGWRAAPSPLTLRANAGPGAAEQLVARKN